MSKHLIVAVFDSAAQASKAANDFKALSEKNIGFTIENGVVVQKDAAGQLAVLNAESHPFKAGVVGAIAGGLLGLLAGPIGVVTGMAAGTGAGMLAGETGEALLDGRFVESVAAGLKPGSAAVVLEAKEATPFSVDNVVTGFCGQVFRQALD